MSIAVAIDGPAGSGKSTIAKLLAKKYGIMYINTGAMYRAVTLFALDRNIDYKDCKGLCNLIDSLSMHFDGDRLLVNGEDVTDKITLPRVSENVSNYSIIPEVRERLVKLQQKIADKYSVVMDGRDIGTVVLKDADVKFFLTADSGERARRRFEELQSKGIDKSYDEILENIKQRDYIDSNRKASPLKQSEDAILIDSTSKTIEQVVETMAGYINKIKEVKKIMSIILAENAGFCFGVKRAVDEALKTVKEYNHKVYTLGPLIHNNDVVEYLKENGIFEIEFDHIDELNTGDVIIIRSHGVSRDVLDKLLEKGLNIVDATCPYVSNIQKKVKKYYTEGYKIIIVGDSTHPEVIGINGWCDYSALISKHGENLENLPHKVCVVSQTTEKEENWENVLKEIIKNCKEFIAFNTICSATSVRQKSARELSENVDLMVVLGGKHSSNTNKLYEICRENCKNTILVENAGEIPEEILSSKTIKKIGVTAGASTPEWIIKEAILKMNNFENVEMNEQLEYMNNNEVRVRIGEKIKGTVLSVNENEVFMNIGYKVDAVLPKDEITKDESVKLSDHFNVGDIVEAKVLKIRNEDGYVVLSRLVMERDEAYKFLSQAYADGTPVTVTIKEVVNGGLVAGYKGIRIFIPASHVELFHVDKLEDYLNKDLEIKIIEYGQERRATKIVGSRRELLKIEKSKKEEEAWQSLHVGDVIEGEVKRLTDFGAFVDVKGVDGLLHVSEISWGRLNRPADVLKVGDMVKASIIDLDQEKKKISLSMKALTEDPWNNVDIKYPVDSIVLGKVARFAKFGAFVELEPGIDALVHISQISHKKINKPSDVLEIGQQIKAKILDVNKENKRVALSIKEAEEI